MLVAYDNQGNLISTLDGLPEGDDFYCPACSGRLILKKGRHIRPHFSHRSLQGCHFCHENESEEHLNLKASLYASLSRTEEVVVESYLPRIGQTADLMVNQRLVLEVQCSPLSQERLRERTLTYQTEGISVIWLLGEKLWLKHQRLNKCQRDFLYFSPNIGFYLWELDAVKHLVRLKYMIHENIFGKLVYLVKEVDFDDDLMALLRFPYTNQIPFQIKVKSDKGIAQCIYRKLLSGDKRWLKAQEEAYLKGENLLLKSDEEFFPHYRFPWTNSCQISLETSSYNDHFLTYYTKQKGRKEQVLFPPKYYK